MDHETQREDPPLVVGLDLSLRRSGIAYSNGVILTVPSRGKATDSLYLRHLRLMGISVSVIEHVYAHGKPVLVVIEGPSPASVGGHSHDRSGLWWSVVHALALAGIPVAEVSPSCRTKYAAGKGNADKDTVMLAVARRYAETFQVSNNDEADAVALCDMGCAHLGHPLAKVPEKNREALAAVAWPSPGEI